MTRTPPRGPRPCWSTAESAGATWRCSRWVPGSAAALVTLLDLELIIVGGGLVMAGDLYLAHMCDGMERHIFARQHRVLPPIALARLGADAGWIGAGLLSLHQWRREPNLTGTGVE